MLKTPGRVTEESTIPLASAARRRPSRARPIMAMVVLTLIILVIQFVRYCYSQMDAASLSGENLPIKSSADLPRFSRVEPYLYRGGAPSLQGLKDLKKIGVKTVVDFRLSADKILWERSQCAALGMEYVSLPIKLIPSDETQRTLLSILDAASKDPARAPVFIHCSHGSDRTSWAVALWRVNHDGWSLPQAAAEMVNNGFFIHRFNR